MSYDTLELPFYTAPAISSAEKIGVYDSLDADVVQSYMEYSLASLLFFTLKEGACSEQSSRMTAMDSASKNAGEFGSIDVPFPELIFSDFSPVLLMVDIFIHSLYFHFLMYVLSLNHTSHSYSSSGQFSCQPSPIHNLFSNT